MKTFEKQKKEQYLNLKAEIVPQNNNTRNKKCLQNGDAHTHTPFFSLCHFFFPLSSTFLGPGSFCPVMYGFFLQWLFQSAARDVINFIHTLWMLCLGGKKKRRREKGEERREERGKGREGERPGE